MSFALLALLVLLFSLGGSSRKIYIKTISRLLLVISMSFYPAFVEKGHDSDEYYFIYNTVIDNYDLSNVFAWVGLSSENVEIGFYFLLKLCRLLSLGDETMYFACLILCNSLMVLVIYRFRYPVAVFMMLILSEFYLQEGNLLRQLIAVSFGLYGLKFINEKSISKYLTCVLLAFIFHKTAILLLLFAPLCYAKESWWSNINFSLLMLWGVSLIFGLKMVTLDLPGLRFLFEDTRYGDYFDTMKETEIGFDWFCNFIMIFYFVFNTKKEKNNIYALFFTMSCVMTNFTTGIMTLRRMMLFFLPIYFAYAPTVLTNNKLISDKNDGMESKILPFAIFFIYYFRMIFIRL